jgi:hypothetical protein
MERCRAFRLRRVFRTNVRSERYGLLSIFATTKDSSTSSLPEQKKHLVTMENVDVVVVVVSAAAVVAGTHLPVSPAQNVPVSFKEPAGGPPHPFKSGARDSIRDRLRATCFAMATIMIPCFWPKKETHLPCHPFQRHYWFAKSINKRNIVLSSR